MKKLDERLEKKRMRKVEDKPELVAKKQLQEPAGSEKISAGGSIGNDKQPGKASDGHKVAGLSCKMYGGPSDEDAAEMVFWRDIPEDAGFVSPHKRKNDTQYLTFEPGTSSE